MPQESPSLVSNEDLDFSNPPYYYTYNSIESSSSLEQENNIDIEMPTKDGSVSFKTFEEQSVFSLFIK